MVAKFFKHYVYPIATLSGSIIGVGFLALPYITLRVGAWPMFFYFVAITALVVFIHVIFARISLKTPDFKRWPGFVGFYLGSTAKKIILVSMVLGSFGIMLAYLIVGSHFLAAIVGPVLGGTELGYLLVYFILVSAMVYVGIAVISRF